MDQEARVSAVRDRLGELKAGLSLAKTAPACRECIYAPIDGSGRGPCENPVHWEMRYDATAGELAGKTDRVTTTEARAEDGLCGPEGLLFEPYQWWRKGFRWIARLHPEVQNWVLAGLLFLVWGGLLLALEGW